MKLDTNIPDHYTMIAKFLAGEMTPSEERNFEGILNMHPQNQSIYKEMKKYWKTVENQSSNQYVNTDKAWENLFGKLKSENLVEPRKEVSLRPLNLAKWAAMLLALITVGSLIFFYTIDRINNSLIAIETTSETGSLVQTLADGSVVYLAANSKLTYQKNFGKNNRQLTLNGEAFFDVTSMPDKPFEIKAFDMKVEVLGTSFNVKSSNSDSFELSVESGTVRVMSTKIADQSMMAIAGERVTLSNQQLTKSTLTENSYTDWKKQRMQFKDEPIGRIIEVINKNYNANIVIDPIQLNSRRITVTFENSSIPSMVDVICATLNLQPESVNGVIILSLPNDAK